MTEKQILALQAVLYGCGTNNKTKGGYYVKRNDMKKRISFDEAFDIVANIIIENTDKE